MSLKKNLELEICSFSYHSCKIAEQAGAHRIELCGGFLEGGTTPSYGLAKKVVQEVQLPAFVMLRPRGGDFCYTGHEQAVIMEDIEALKTLKPGGFVFGALNVDGSIDVELCTAVVAACAPFPVTFHRAFDVSSNLEESLETVIELGFERILTSGGKANVDEGFSSLIRLNAQAAGRIKIMAGAGVGLSNIHLLVENGINHCHTTAKEWVQSEMQYKNNEVSMASGVLPDEFGRFESQKDIIRALLKK